MDRHLDYKDPDWVANRLGLDKNTVYKFLQDGLIPAIHLGRKWLISEARLIEWLEKEAETQTRARRDAAQAAERTVQLIDNFTVAARMALKQGHSEARRYGHSFLGQEHLLLGLMSDTKSVAARALRLLGVESAAVRNAIGERSIQTSPLVPRRLGRNVEAKRAMRLAARLAKKNSPAGERALVGTDHLLMGILLARRGLGFEILKRHNITRALLRPLLAQPVRPKGETDAERIRNSQEGDRNGRPTRRRGSQSGVGGDALHQ